MKKKFEVELLSHTPNPEFTIVDAARTCYMSRADSEPDENGKIKLGKSDTNLLKALINSGHLSTLEHSAFTFRIKNISRSCSHQLVRHRIASYSQKSQRYVSEKDFDYIIPPDISEKDLESEFSEFMEIITEKYKYFIEKGIKKEDARYILPNACATEIVVTMNARSLLNFFSLRLDKHAQWEIRMLAKEMYLLVNRIAPIIFPEKNID